MARETVVGNSTFDGIDEQPESAIEAATLDLVGLAYHYTRRAGSNGGEQGDV